MPDLFDTPASILEQYADPEAVESFIAYRKKHKRAALTPDVLSELIEYDPLSGSLTWTSRPATMFKDKRSQKVWNSRYAGTPALACLDTSTGYLRGSVLGLKMFAHRAAYMIYSGEDPRGLIDHINKNRTDNRAINLRAVSFTENARNVSPSGESGVVGVYWSEQVGKWQAKIRIGSRSYSGGYYLTKDLAAEARKRLEEKHWG